jgi:signal transduction histidine kinase
LNAVKYRKPDVPPRIVVDGRALADGFWEITVEDNGIGFDEKYSERIFKPFQRLHSKSEYPGTGMGLTICQKIVQRLGGAISAQGRLGEGATFTVRLPEKQPYQTLLA